MLVNSFHKIAWAPSLDSKTGHYISTAAHHASLSLHVTATERSENATSSCSTARAHITAPTWISIMDTSIYSGYVAVVLSTVLKNEWLRTNNNWVFILYNRNHTFFMQVVSSTYCSCHLAIEKKTSKLKYMYSSFKKSTWVLKKLIIYLSFRTLQ